MPCNSPLLPAKVLSISLSPPLSSSIPSSYLFPIVVQSVSLSMLSVSLSVPLIHVPLAHLLAGVGDLLGHGLGDDHVLARLVRIVRVQGLDPAHHIHAVNHRAEHHVLAVQPRGLHGRDEELAAIRVGTWGGERQWLVLNESLNEYSALSLLRYPGDTYIETIVTTVEVPKQCPDSGIFARHCNNQIYRRI
jgi:hypothetical protein